MKYIDWKYTKKIEDKFRKALEVLCDIFEKISIETNGNISEYENKMNEFQNTIQYNDYINHIVERMVTPLDISNQKTWRKASEKSTQGKYFYSLLLNEIDKNLSFSIKSIILDNVNLIKTLPNDTAKKVLNNISELTFSGLRSSEIAKIISKETNKHSRASARLIARTEVAKTQSALTRVRSEELDINWYVWRTAQDGNRVRKSHRNMEGVLVNWNNPPSPESLVNEKNVGYYHAGNIWNCRCYSEPLIDLNDVRWPHKVYYDGKIQNMTKEQFLKISI